MREPQRLVLGATSALVTCLAGMVFHTRAAGLAAVRTWGGTNQGPPFLHEYYVPSHHADAAFLLAVRRGVVPHHWDFGPMPPIDGLSDDDVAAIVAHVRQEPRDAGLVERS